MRYPSERAYLAAHSPQEHDENLWSMEADPPLSERIDALTIAVARFAAAFFTMKGGEGGTPVPPSAFLPRWLTDPDVPPEGEGEGEPAATDAERAGRIGAAMAAHGARERNMPLVPGHGAKVPVDVFAAFAKADQAAKD